MQSANDGEWVLPPKISEAVIRILRHEVGDLLQTVYSAAAVLNQRLPDGWELERRVVGDMRTRGETCRRYLDYTHDLVCALRISKERFDAGESLTDLLKQTASRHPTVRVHLAVAAKLVANADPQKLESVFQLLTTFACESATDEAWVQIKPGEEPFSLDGVIEYDGGEVSAESCEALLGLLNSGQNARSRLGLLLAQKLIQLHGGCLMVMPRGGGGMRLCIHLPGEDNTAASSQCDGSIDFRGVIAD